MQIIQMDGDYYGVVLPYRTHWDQVPRSLCSKRFFFQRKTFASASTHLEVLLATKHGEVNGLVTIREEDRLQMSHLTEKIGYLCPMLLPLDTNGFFDASVQGDMPNGTIVTGGSFYINEKKLPISKPRRMKEEDKFSIGDTTGDPDYDIQWVWVNGCMVCIDEFVSCHTSYPVKHRLLGGDFL